MNQTGQPTLLSRRRVLSVGCSALGALALAACGQNAGSGQPAGQPAAAAGQMVFLGRDSGSEVEPFKQGIEKFNAKQSRVKVTHDLATGNFEQKLQTLVAGGTPPDASYMHSQNVATFAVAGILAPMDAYVKRDKGAADGILPAALDSYRWKNALYGMPDVATSLVMYVNKGLFQRAGVTLPAEKWTWADYLAVAQRISNAGKADGVFGSVDYNGGFPRFTVLWQNEGDILNKDRNQVTIDKPEAVEAFTWIADQTLKTRVHAGPLDLQGKGSEAFFLEGKAAILPALSSRMGTIAKGAQFEVEVIHLPQGKKRVTRTACGGTALIKGGKNTDAAWELEKFFGTEEFQWLQAKVGGIIFPAHKKVAESPELFTGAPFPKSPKVTVDAMEYARIEPYTVRYVDMVSAMNKEVDTIWKGESNVKDALTRAKAAIEPILQDALTQIK
jgi:multiple sugar transport system substrate-binding protein